MSIVEDEAEKSIIPFNEFKKLDMRVGKILAAERVPETTHLLKLKVDFGDQQLQAVSGLAQQYNPEDLIGKKHMFIINLERKKFRGIESQCMIFAAEDKQGKLALMAPDKDIEAGSKVY